MITIDAAINKVYYRDILNPIPKNLEKIDSDLDMYISLHKEK